MSTRPGEHQGWASRTTCGELAAAPLQRPRQPAADPRAGGRRAAAYGDNDAELFAVVADFEATYGQYAEFQDRMEHYWCLRWLLQEGVQETGATVIRENLVRFDRLPLIVRLPDLPTARRARRCAWRSAHRSPCRHARMPRGRRGRRGTPHLGRPAQPPPGHPRGVAAAGRAVPAV